MFEINWSEKAKSNLQNILVYWVNRNKSSSYSEKIASEILQKQDILLLYPFYGEETNYKGVRRILVLHNFSLFYIIDEESKIIKILSFRDNRRKPKF